MALVNGEGYNHTTLNLGLLGNPTVAGFLAIQYSTVQQKQNNMGAGTEPVERTRGGKTYAGSITLSVKEIIRIREAAGKRSLTEIPPFPATLSYSNGFDPVTTDVLQYVEFTEDNISSAVGNTAIEVVCPIVIGGILYNQ